MPQYAGELKSGAYIITSCAANLPIARRSIEDKQVVEELYNQTVPKPVRVVTMAEDSSDLAWDFQEIEHRTFILRSRGTPTNTVENGIGASIVYSPPPTLWRVRHAIENSDTYMITSEDTLSAWWATGDEPGSQVELRPLSPPVTDTDLLSIPVNHLFRLTLLR